MAMNANPFCSNHGGTVKPHGCSSPSAIMAHTCVPISAPAPVTVRSLNLAPVSASEWLTQLEDYNL